MRYLVVVLIWFSFAPGCLGQSSHQIPSIDFAERSQPVYDLDTIIVKPKSSSFLSAEQPFNSQEAQSLGLSPTPEPIGSGLFVYKLQSQTWSAQTVSESERLKQLEDLVVRLNQRNDIDYAELNQLAQPHVIPNDPYWIYQWNLKTWKMRQGGSFSPGGISMPEAWNKRQLKQKITVAVLDTGLVFNHPDIKGGGNFEGGHDFITNDWRANDGQPGRDPDPTDHGDGVLEGERKPANCRNRPSGWHGTHVAGIIGVGRTNNGSSIAGINNAVRILPIRVLGRCGGDDSDIADAIKWAAGEPVEGVPDNKFKAQIINMSLGSKDRTCRKDLQDAIDLAVKRGVTVVVSAGNDKNDVADNSPANCQNVVVVAASDARGHFVESYSSFGLKVDIMAPGGDLANDYDNDGRKDGVLSYTKVSRDFQAGVVFSQGTSMAAPHVAGVMALMLSYNPKLTRQELLSIVKETARKRTLQQCPKRCGAGLLDAEKAVAAAIARLSTRPDPLPPVPRPPKKTPPPSAILPNPWPIRPVCCCADYDCLSQRPYPPYPYPILYPDECSDDVYYTDYD